MREFAGTARAGKIEREPNALNCKRFAFSRRRERTSQSAMRDTITNLFQNAQCSTMNRLY